MTDDYFQKAAGHVSSHQEEDERRARCIREIEPAAARLIAEGVPHGTVAAALARVTISVLERRPEL